MKAIIYKSKIGIGTAVLGVGIITATLILMIIVKSWFGIAVDVLALAFVLHMFLTTYYTIDDHTLRIKCGFLYSAAVEIAAIKKVTETNNPISSPAASLDRLEIQYNKWDRVMVSPKEKDAFINHLMTINPAIEVKLKSTSA